MKQRFMAVLIFVTGVCTAALALEPASDDESAAVRKRLIPLPVSVVLGTSRVGLDETLKITVAAEHPDEARRVVETIFPRWFGKSPTVSVEKNSEPIPADGYKMTAERDTLRIAAADRGGVLNALKTLRQLVEPNRDAEKLRAYSTPELEISDAPALGFRGLHLCWFPETDPARIEQAIRLAAYYKLNVVVLEMWGTFRFEKRPDFCWSSIAVGKDEIRRLVNVGRELGITLVPQFNLFGHASASRASSGKHAILDFHPEYQPLFEPDGWTWCLSNPATRPVLTELVLELYEAFDSPPYFHLGCDEAHSAASCPLCRKADYTALLLDHLTYFCELFGGRGCRTMMWHDMLVTQQERFKGYVAFGNATTAAVLDRLPKKMILCDWQYSAPKKDESWPTLTYFKDKGFDVIACPWNQRAGIESLGKKVQDEKLFGLLETTWHHLDGATMRMMLATGARAAWGTRDSGSGDIEIDCHLRQVGWDMPKLEYHQTGVVTRQVPVETSGPR